MAQSKFPLSVYTVIAIFAFAMLGFFTFMGNMFVTGGKIGICLAVALVCVVVLALLLNGAVYCRKTWKEVPSRRALGISLLAMFILVAIYPAFPVAQFFTAMANKTDYQAMAASDHAAILGMFDDYEIFEREAIATTRISLKNAIGAKDNLDTPVHEYLRRNNISNLASIDNWLQIQEDRLLGDKSIDGVSYYDFKRDTEQKLNQWLSDINKWDILTMLGNAGKADEYAEEVARKLSEYSRRGELAIIIFYPSKSMYCKEKDNQTIKITPPKLSLEHAIKNPSGPSPASFLFYPLIILLMLLPFFTARTKPLPQHLQLNSKPEEPDYRIDIS